MRSRQCGLLLHVLGPVLLKDILHLVFPGVGFIGNGYVLPAACETQMNGVYDFIELLNEFSSELNHLTSVIHQLHIPHIQGLLIFRPEKQFL